MKAVVLAAGMGRRLAPLTDRTHKCLLPVGDHTLLTRVLASLDAIRVREAVLVVGHCSDQLRKAGGSRVGRMRVRYIENPGYEKGSALSLYAARAHLHEPALVMPADVLFPREFLRRLLAAPAPSALLLDRGLPDSGEAMRLYTRGDRVIALGAEMAPEAWDQVGEGVGVFKCGAEAAPELVRLLERVITEGAGRSEYEDALRLLVRRRHVGWTDVTGLPWTDIDSAADLRRARDEVLGHVLRLDGE